jgi:L-asparaginase II
MGAVPLVRVVRAGLIESIHLGHIAVCDADGRLIASAGDPNRVVFARSCMKPLQASVALRAIGEPMPDREVAVMCASHNGEPVHVGAVEAVLKRAGLESDALKNPPGWPLDPEAMASSLQPRRLLQNCSGKHAGMLLACVRAGWDPATYLRPGHPLQRRIRRAVLAATDLEDVKIGVDGCGVPVHGMPLRSMATLFARLGSTERLGVLAPNADRAVEAMLAEPYLVGGRHSYDTELMRVSGDVVAKRGAEALECAAIPRQALGVAVKIDDGGSRAGAPALIATVRKLGGLSGAEVRELAPYALPRVTGGGRTVGHLEIAFDLRTTGRRPTARTVRRS